MGLSPCGLPAAYCGLGPLGPVPVLQLARGNLFERDLQVVLRARLDHRRRVLVERSLTEVVVVRVDLAGALGGHQDTRVMRVDALEKRVESGLDHEESPRGCSSQRVATRLAS